MQVIIETSETSRTYFLYSQCSYLLDLKHKQNCPPLQCSIKFLKLLIVMMGNLIERSTEEYKTVLNFIKS
jgi:hypothetical protein